MIAPGPGAACRAAAAPRTGGGGRVYTCSVTRAFVVALLGFALAASEPAVPTVRIDAIVTDRSGTPILDLRPSDFELRENGLLRPIGAVELRAASRTVPANPEPIGSEADEARAAREAGTRVFAIVLDEFHVASGAASDRVRASLARFVDERLHPGDMAAVIKPLEPVGAVRFTRDRAALGAAIAAFAGRKGDYAPRSTFEQQYIGHAPATVETARRQILSAALRQLAMRLGELRADRGVIVLVSEGFSRPPAPRQVRVPDLQALVRAASRFHLAVYTFNPADRTDGTDSPTTATLEWLAAQSGGRASLDGALLDEGLRRMSADLDAYYALTYQPAQADGRFHAVEIVARRPNAQVRTRPGYWASLAGELRTLLDPPAEPIARRALRRSATINAWTGVSRGADGRPRLAVTWEPRAGQPRVVRISAKTAGGESLFAGEIAAAGSAVAGTPDLAVFGAPPGRVELDMTILSMSGATLDIDVRDVVVPDVSARAEGPLIFTPEVIRARTAPEFREFSTNPGVAPTPSRAFTRGDRLIIRVPAWDPGGSPVSVTATIANARGGSMRTIDRSDRTDGGAAQFVLPLAWLAPGAYQILLSAKSGTGEAKEAVRFSVR